MVKHDVKDLSLASKGKKRIEWANNGDIVYVKSGLYEENIRINKQIEIIGEEKNSTIISSINKSEYLIIDSVDNIIIENITFSYSGSRSNLGQRRAMIATGSRLMRSIKSKQARSS